jgi:hypothetical protein
MIELGGRRFQVVALATVRWDYWMCAKLRQAGIDEIAMAPGQTAMEFTNATLGRLLDSEQTLELIGGFLAPEEFDLRNWSPATAHEMAAFIGGLTDPTDKLTIRGLLAQALAGFFLSAGNSLARSPTSSPVASAAVPERSASAALSGSANGT